MSTRKGPKYRGNYGNPSRYLRRPPKPRAPQQQLDKSVLNKGVYANPRFTHAATSLIGCNVLVEVKNGNMYSGIFRTFSCEMELVLEMVHKVEDLVNPHAVPAKDRLLDKIVFEPKDIVKVEAINVDLDYATKGNHPLNSFTDLSISKYNGQATDREMKTLEPWEGGAGESLEGLDGDSSNGWDANEMFKTNEGKFNVQSSYDPNLSQYTIPLEKRNTQEYKQRELEASRLAREIEHNETYSKNIDLENGEGETEEEKFSAVHRPTDGKYVPPHMRSARQPQNTQNNRSMKTTNGPPGAAPPKQPEPTENKVNGEDRKTAAVAVSNTMTVDEPPQAPTAADRSRDKSPADLEKKHSNPKAFDPKLEDLKQFSSTFKLSEENKEQKPSRSGSMVAPPQQQNPHMVSPHAQRHEVTSGGGEEWPAADPQGAAQLKQQQPKPQGSPMQAPASPVAPDKMDVENKEEQKKIEEVSETVRTSKLNPNAKEFVFNPSAKPFQPRQPMQTPTPPRPQAPSPVMPPVAPMQGQINYQYMMPVSMASVVNPHNTPQPRFAGVKRAVVSVGRPEYSPAAQAAAAQAAAATGTPLMAQPPQYTQQQYTFQYVQPQMMGQPGTPLQVPQVMQVAPGARVMGPMVPAGSHPGDQQTGSVAPQQLQHPQVLVPAGSVQPGAAAVPAHLPPGGSGPPHPAHMAPHHQPTPPHTQASHMNSQGGHHNPSPVQPGHGQHPMQGHPPTPGTPQPQVVYQPNHQIAQQAGHPPLQPSPHTPTSPQAFQPGFPYQYSQQGGMPGQPQMMASQGHPHQHLGSQGAGSHQQQQPQFVMMPQPQGPPQGQPGPHGQVQAPQFQPPMQQAHIPGSQINPHSGVATMPVSTPTNVHHQVHYVAHPPMPSQGHPGQVQNFHHTQ